MIIHLLSIASVFASLSGFAGEPNHCNEQPPVEEQVGNTASYEEAYSVGLRNLCEARAQAFEATFQNNLAETKKFLTAQAQIKCASPSQMIGEIRFDETIKANAKCIEIIPAKGKKALYSQKTAKVIGTFKCQPVICENDCKTSAEER